MRPAHHRLPSSLGWIFCLLAATSIAGAARGQSPALPGERSGARLVRSIRPLFDHVGRAAWSTQGDWIAFDRPDAEGFLDIWVAHPDGSAERCLTCLPLEFKRRHAGDPTWHPSGRYIVFLLERPHQEGGEPVPFSRVPGANRGDDLWAISIDGQQFNQITNRGEHGGHVISPRFSREGDRLVWGERVETGGGAWGGWVLRVGKFTASRGLPRLGKVKSYSVGDRNAFYEPYGFTADDRGVLFAANLDPGQSENSLDLYILRPEGGELMRLTSSSTDLDRHASLSPNGRWIVWSSSHDLGGSPAPVSRGNPVVETPLDLWLMDDRGLQIERLTALNDPISTDYAGRVTVTFPAWSPAGDRLLILVTPLDAPQEAALYTLELDQPIGE